MKKITRTLMSCALFSLVGLAIGALLGAGGAQAGDPGNDLPLAHPTTWYHEKWSATSISYLEATNAAAATYVTRLFVAGGASATGDAAARTAPAAAAGAPAPASSVLVAPKILVTQWTVKGHIHFQ